MEVSSSTQGASAGVGQVDIIKKAQDLQEQQVMKILESTQQQSQEINAQKTGIGKNLNITG